MDGMLAMTVQSSHIGASGGMAGDKKKGAGTTRWNEARDNEVKGSMGRSGVGKIGGCFLVELSILFVVT